MTTVLDGPAEVRAAAGAHLGYSEWLEVTAQRLEQFADATRGAGIEYLTLSLSNLFLPQIVEVRGFSAGLNYGVDRVRFPAPVAAGDRLRGEAVLTEVTELDSGLQTKMLITIDIDGADEPACVIESISRWLL